MRGESRPRPSLAASRPDLILRGATSAVVLSRGSFVACRRRCARLAFRSQPAGRGWRIEEANVRCACSSCGAVVWGIGGVMAWELGRGEGAGGR
jgi:hypothetical protein